jgi:tRNA(Ile)-lysidine synthase
MARTPVHSLLKNIKRFLDQHQVREGKVLVAVSGGPDSVALLQAMHELAGKFQITLLAGHLNHRLRGEESDGDAEFVRQFCHERAITCVIDCVSDSDLQPKQSHLESQARLIRYQWLEKIASQEKCRWIMTGHTMNDQAETVLHHLLRGTGWRGMRGIAPSRRLSLLESAGDQVISAELPLKLRHSLVLLRPLLTTTRVEVLEFLEQRQIRARTDSSNDDPRFMRNRLRHQIMPVLDLLVNRQAVRHLAQLSERARRIYPLIRRSAQLLLKKATLPVADGVFVLDQRVLSQAKGDTLQEALLQLWQRNGWPSGQMNAARWHEVMDVCRLQRPRVDLPGGIVVRHKLHVIQFLVAE